MSNTAVARLLRAARTAARHSYSPYSGFPVGAAVRTGRGRIYAGTNVENASYGLTLCAERVAIFRAVTAGERDIRAVLVWTDTDEPTPPCGACLQVIHEFGPGATIILAGRTRTRTLRLRDLLPAGFSLKG